MSDTNMKLKKFFEEENMREIEKQKELSMQEMLQKLQESVMVVKKFRQAMKNSLKAIQRTYTYEQFLREFINSSQLTDTAEKLNCKLILPIGSRILTMQSNADSTLKASVKLVYAKDFAEFIKNERRKDEKC